MADGHLNKCKECNKIDVRLNRRDKAEYYSEFDKKRNGSEKRKLDRKIRLVKYREEHPDKNRAHQLVAVALKSGKLIRPKSCEDCGKLDLGKNCRIYTFTIMTTPNLWMSSLFARNVMEKNITN